MRKTFKKEIGITLIALVITIIVLLILAGVSVMMIIGDDGVIQKASNANEETRASDMQEQINLAISENNLLNYSEGEPKTKTDLIEKFVNEGKLTEEEATILENQDTIEIGGIVVDFSGLNQSDESVKKIIPEGATYYIGVTSRKTNDYTGATDILIAGEEFPDTVNTGDLYVYGDYEYRYNMFSNGSSWVNNTNQNGWGVRVRNQTQSTYGSILESINSKSVTNMFATFCACSSLTQAPEIPDGVTIMKNTFLDCKRLSQAPEIPRGVIDMYGTFYGCTFLKTVTTIPSSVDNIGMIFYGCTALKGTIVIDATPGMYMKCFYNSKIDAVKMSDGTTHSLEAELLATK